MLQNSKIFLAPTWHQKWKIPHHDIWFQPQNYCVKLPFIYVYKVYIDLQILCLDLGPIPKVSHYIYENISKSKKKIWNLKYFLTQAF
jgi:hypothetical protein